VVSKYILVFCFSQCHIYIMYVPTSFESLKLTSFPNATVAEYGSYDSSDDTAEIYNSILEGEYRRNKSINACTI
jgi:hypothetical protein